jgi:hypothetical protein
VTFKPGITNPLAGDLPYSYDIHYLKALGINAIIVSDMDPGNHYDRYMSLLSQAGIYVLVVLQEVGAELPIAMTKGRRLAGYDYDEYYKKVVDQFQKYANTLGFVVVVDDSTADGVRSIPWRKGTVRDLKAYIKTKAYREIPVGFSAHGHDINTIAQYMNCNERESSADFFGLDFAYAKAKECPDPDNWLENGIVEMYRNYSIPAFLFYGCMVKLRQDFRGVKQLYSNTTLEVFSGAIAHEWYGDGSDDGLGMLSNFHSHSIPHY